MPKMRLTAAAVERITPPTKGQVDYFDATVPAFGLRVSYAGARTYFAMTRVHGKLVRLTIGRAKIGDNESGWSLADARRKAGELMAVAADGHDPRQMKADDKRKNEVAAKNTFATVAELFMSGHVRPRLAKSTHREYQRALFGQDTAAWANLPVSAITRADVRIALDGMVARGSGGGANNLLAHLRKFFGWCAEKEFLDVPPTDRVKPPADKRIGERTLSEGEIVEVWRAFEAEGGVFGDLFKVLLLTGQRRGEVAGMARCELRGIDCEDAIWEIPGQRTKNGRPHLVPMAKSVRDIVAKRPEIGSGGLIFTTGRRRARPITGAAPSAETSVSGFSKAKGRIDTWIADHRNENGLPPMPDWDIHDLRRTMITMMNDRLGVMPHVVEATVNHISGAAKAGVAGVYNKAVYLAERRAALIAWEKMIISLAAAGNDNGDNA